jgi:TolB-like protein/lipoprotein NlpI
MKMLQKNPADRYENMAAVLKDLKDIESGISIGPSTSRKKPSIAVLPFANISGDKEQEYFCDGLTEELINALTRLGGLRVVARTSAFFFKDKNMKIRDIGRELGVENILEGSVRKSGDRLRITGQLVNVADGYHLWSERFDREMDDVFAIQDEITSAIVNKLKPKLLGKEKQRITKRQTGNVKAYDLYLKGRYFLNKRTEEGLKTALSYFEQATKKAPGYALAYVGLADVYSNLAIYCIWPPRKAYPEAKAAVLKALEIDDMLAEAHASLAAIKASYDWDWGESEKKFKTAIELNPSYPDTYIGYSGLLFSTARFEEAIREAEKALELDPLSLIINRNLGSNYLAAGHYDQAIEALQKTLEMEPNFPRTHLFLGVAYFQQSKYEEAIEEFERAREISAGRDPLAETAIGVTDALLGRRNEACEILDKLMERSKEAYVPSSCLGRLKLALGEIDQGFELMEQAYEERDFWLYTLKTEILFENLDLRSDPRYLALLKKMGLDK